MENDLIELLKTNKVQKGRDYYSVVINKPQDFVYDTSEVVLRYYPDNKSKTIRCAEVPENIKENIHRFDFLSLKEYVKFLEQNLDAFFRGEVPELVHEEQEMLKPGELPKSFKFPVNNAVTSNLKYDISKTNILLFCCLKPNVVARCSKCGEATSLGHSTSCRRCGMGIGLVYVPVIDSESLGFLQLKKCEFVCFNPMQYQFSCLECHRAYESKEINMGEVYVQKCYGCFNELKIKINKLEYYQQRDVRVKEGEELPDKGACKHYKKSFRWLRFSCCNSLYPCDICHDEQSGHKNQIANRMVCGLCSKEQSVKKECDCGMCTVKRHTQFWEGGKGNRDKATLSKKDPKKHSYK